METFSLDQIDLLLSIDQSYEGFLLSDLDGRVFYANHSVSVMAGVSLDEIVGKTPEEMEKDGLIISQSMQVLKKDPLTIYQKLRTGKEIFITSKPIFNKEGHIECFAANYRDLNELNELYKLHQEKINLNYTELQQLRLQVIETGDWISSSEKTNEIKVIVRKVAKTDAVILITGESGTGKEVIAKNIHKLSDRKTKPYIQINCGAIPEHLIEAELFGYEKGAFTGANAVKHGLLEAADGGTVLLDEVGEMPLHLQVKLLRAIQTYEITRVGGTKPKQLDVRFLAATNRDLEKLVAEGKFREDLFYRLNVIPIHIPPLRERQEDIRSLCDYFLQKINEKYHKNKTLSAQARLLFDRYEWPGNVRQLENMIEHLVILVEGSVITADALPKEFNNFNIKDQSIKALSQKIIPLKIVRDEAERNMIELALAKYKTIRQAAKHLEVDHSTLVRKIQRLDRLK